MPSLKSSAHHPLITPQTKFYGVIGQPIGHSLSPIFHNAAFVAEKIDAIYVALEVPPAELTWAIEAARAWRFGGLNVTIPHKQNALTYCQPDALAAQVGAVNTLLFDGAGVRGTNTDVIGFARWFQSIAKRTGQHPHRALLLGAGGAARAVLLALHNMGITDITVATRRTIPSDQFSVPVKTLAWPAITDGLAQTDVLIDATGQSLFTEEVPLALEKLPNHAWVLDLVARKTTPLVKRALAISLTAETGVEMLLEQGIAAWEQWIGRPAPAKVMRQALYSAL